MVERLDYDEFVIEELRKIYGTRLNELLNSLLVPNSRLYIRVNTLKISPEELEKEMPFLKRDEDFEEAMYVEVRGPNKIAEHDTKVIVDKRTAESVMTGANVYKPGIKRIIGSGKEVTVISENGIPVAEGILTQEGMVKVTVSLYSAPQISEYEGLRKGYFILQGKASMHVAHLLDPQPGENIVDMTAHPGGKLTHVYQLQPKSRVIGFDHTVKKVEDLKRRLEILNMREIEVYKADSRYLYEDFHIQNVDKVLIDPPCSALGLRPKIYDKKTKTDLLNLSAYQRQFLNSAYKILKRGGVLIYSTCTMTEIENEEIINDSKFEVEEIIRFHPIIHDMTGFFIAKLRKRE